jgi:glutathione peroxidase-family protein
LGHGRTECGNPSKIRNLQKYFTNYTSPNVLSQDRLAQFCPVNVIKTFLPQGSFVEVYGGMGSTVYVRNHNGSLQGIVIGNQDWHYNQPLIDEKDNFVKSFSQHNLTNDQLDNISRSTV